MDGTLPARGLRRGGLPTLSGNLGCDRDQSRVLVEARCTQLLTVLLCYDGGVVAWGAAPAVAERGRWGGCFV